MVRLICMLRESLSSISFILIGQFENVDNSYWFIFWTDSDLFAAGDNELQLSLNEDYCGAALSVVSYTYHIS